MYIPSRDRLTEEEKDRYEMICRQEIGPLILLMEQVRRKGVSPQYVSSYLLSKLRCALKRWERDGLLEPEDNALLQATEHASSLAFARWNDEPLKEWLGKWKPKLVASRTKMRRTK